MPNTGRVALILLIMPLVLVVGCQTVNDRDSEKGYYTYRSPEDAIDDAKTDELIDAVQSKGYFVYRHPKEALDDIDTETLLDELRFNKETYPHLK